MPEYRIPLEGGDVLVVTLAIEEAAETPLPEPEALGTALLRALGMDRPVISPGPKAVRRNRPAPPPEENPDTWLRRTSEKSLGAKFKRNTRADGDVGE